MSNTPTNLMSNICFNYSSYGLVIRVRLWAFDLFSTNTLVIHVH